MMSWVAKKLSLVQETKLYTTWNPNEEETFTLQIMQPMKATQKVLEIIVSYLQRHAHFSIEKFNKPVGFSALQNVTTIADWAIVPYVELFESLSFDQQVLIWHITTELCFHWNSDSQHPLYHHKIEMKVEEYRSEGLKRMSLEMEACKYLSNYMMHKMLIPSNIMSIIGGVNFVLFWNAIDEMVKFIRKSCDNHGHLLKPNEKVEEVCLKMMTTPIDLTKNKFLIDIARVLAHLMLVIREEERWQVITTAWVELLKKWAKNSKANAHMKQLSRGDELLTLVWLFNRHVDMDDMLIPFIYDAMYDRYEKAAHLLSEIELHLH